jgi:hypothetical protein
MKNIGIVCVLASLGVLDGCGGASVRNAYEGAERADSDVAVLFTPSAAAATDKKRRAFFSGIDGKEFGTSSLTWVLPGTHLIAVSCTDAEGGSFPLFQATLERGHYYELGCSSVIDRGTSADAVKRLLDPALAEQLRR